MSGIPGFFELNALDPHDQTGCGVIKLKFQKAHLKGLMKKNLAAKYSRIQLIPEVVQHPIMVLKGWEREGYEDALIYVGRPRIDFRNVGIETSPPKNMLFMVFVTPTNHIISDWRWELSDETDPNSPKNLKKRCGSTLWPKPTNHNN